MEGPRQEEVLLAAKRALGCTDEDLTLLDYSVEQASDQPTGFMGTHLRVLARVRLRAQGDGVTVVRLFAKAPPRSAFHRDYVALCGFFSRERRMLASYSPRLRAALPGGPGPVFPMPQCYAAREEAEGELILMEDLAFMGFEMADKWLPFTLPECRAVLGALARLHGASTLLQEQDEVLRREFEGIEEPVFFHDMEHPSCLWNRSSAETFATAVSLLWPERFKGADGRKRVLDTAWASWMDVFRAVRKSDKYLNVLCHGDTWPNNIMFRRQPPSATTHLDAGNEMEPQTGDPEVVLVDFQLHRYAPPVLDILFFLYSSTRRALRDEHWQSLLRHYREVFSSVVSTDVADRILPWEQLVQSADDLRVFGRYLSGTALLAVVLPVLPPKGGGEKEGDFIEGMLKDRGAELVARMRADPGLKERLTEAYVEYLESVGLWE